MDMTKKLEQIGNTINNDCQIEKKSGMPNKFKVPKTKIEWKMKGGKI